jgi:prevent-host-death family protein
MWSNEMKINILDAKSQLSKLIKSAHAGKEVIIANRGQPVARLLPIRGAQSDGAGTIGSRDFLQWLKNNPLPAYAQRSAAEIDAGIEAERNGWD